VNHCLWLGVERGRRLGQIDGEKESWERSRLTRRTTWCDGGRRETVRQIVDCGSVGGGRMDEKYICVECGKVWRARGLSHVKVHFGNLASFKRQTPSYLLKCQCGRLTRLYASKLKKEGLI
jgi:hypothetical protein